MTFFQKYDIITKNYLNYLLGLDLESEGGKMSISLNSYCIIKQINSNKLCTEDFICLKRANKLNGNALLCYRYADYENNLKFAVLGDILEKNGDYCLLENIADCASDNLIFSESEWGITIISNQSFDVLFEKEINKIRFMYCLSDKERAISRMEQIGFPPKNIESFKSQNVVYVYEGFTSIPLSQVDNNGLKQIATREKNLYAIIADSLDDKRFILLYSQKEDYFDVTKTKSGYLFRIGAIHWDCDGHYEPTNAIIQSCNGGVWVAPDMIRCDIRRFLNK